MRSWCAETLAQTSPVTTEFYFSRLSTVPAEEIEALLLCPPQEARSRWKLCISSYSYAQLVALKNFMAFLCRHSLGGWAPSLLDLIAQLPLPKVDKYASVRTGEAFLTVDEEASIISHLDAVVRAIRAEDYVSDDDLTTAAILLCSYQFGLRGKQIAMLEMRNVRIWEDGLDSSPSVHLTFQMIKQRSEKRVFPMVRRVKRDWAPLFVALFERLQQSGLRGSDHVFQLPPAELTKRLADLTEQLLGRRRFVRELRHTAAQRMVDAGATEEEAAAFLGHSDLDTPLIYFNSSAAQGERVNRALGLSAVYQRVVRIAHDNFISQAELAALKGDQQVAGVPHGIPISGIGGCSSGQPTCPYNPVLSCYGCPRFMPLSDVRVHSGVLNDLRGVLKVFYTASRAERGSPAFQLEQTIAEVQSVIDELGAKDRELLL
jgi:integrase